MTMHISKMMIYHLLLNRGYGTFYLGKTPTHI